MISVVCGCLWGMGFVTPSQLMCLLRPSGYASVEGPTLMATRRVASVLQVALNN
jgi:hypothetical protein